MSAPVTIAHLINPFQPPAGSEWEYVQPITFASMKAAVEAVEEREGDTEAARIEKGLGARGEDREAARIEKGFEAPGPEVPGPIKVSLLTAQFPEDRTYIPDYFIKTPDLERSVLDFHPTTTAPKYPLIGDLMARLYENSDAEYLVYTNIDIAVQPGFYAFIAEQTRRGLKAFIINRRRIPDRYRKVEELPEMYAEEGKPHPGFDCFVFHRSLYPHFRFAHVCVGIPFIGILTAQNLFAFGEPFALFEDEHLTFHIGEDVFKPRHRELMQHNRAAFWKAIGELWPHLDNRKWPYGKRWMPLRLIKWGLHPSLPIRLGLKLEWRRWFGK